MRNKEHRAAEILQGIFQDFFRIDVQVVRWLELEMWLNSLCIFLYVCMYVFGCSLFSTEYNLICMYVVFINGKEESNNEI